MYISSISRIFYTCHRQIFITLRMSTYTFVIKNKKQMFSIKLKNAKRSYIYVFQLTYKLYSLINYKYTYI